MKRKALIVLCLMALMSFSTVSLGQAATGEVLFGTGISDDWKLVDEGTEFDTNLITCAFFAKKPFGQMTLIISIYQKDASSNGQKLLLRSDIEVNPEWTMLALPELPLPGVGEYIFSLSTPSGESLSVGSVVIREKVVEEKMPQQPKVEGATLESLFNKFTPKQ